MEILKTPMDCWI